MNEGGCMINKMMCVLDEMWCEMRSWLYWRVGKGRGKKEVKF